MEDLAAAGTAHGDAGAESSRVRRVSIDARAREGMTADDTHHGSRPARGAHAQAESKQLLIPARLP